MTASQTTQLYTTRWFAGHIRCMLPRRWVSPEVKEHLQLDSPYTTVVVKLLTGTDMLLRMESDQPLTAVKGLISQQTGIPTNRQVLVVKESKRLVQGSTFQGIATAWKTRKGIRSLILGLVNFALLPQAVSRELTGQGFYSWAKGGLQQRLRHAQTSTGSVNVQVESLAGHVTTISVASESSLAGMQQLVQQQTGMLLDRQHVTIEERLPAGVLDQVANQVLLYSCFSLQAAGQVAIWAHARLRLLCAANTFPLQVTTASGEMVCVDARMDMTLAQIHKLAAASANARQHPASHHTEAFRFPSVF